MRTEIVNLKQSTGIMHDLAIQDQPFHELTDPLNYTGLLKRLREIASTNAKSVVFLFGSGAPQIQQLKRIRRNKGPALGDMTVYAVEVPHA